MTKQLKKPFTALLLGFVFFLGMNTYVLALVFANNSEIAFESTSPAYSEGLDLREDIVHGAEKFLVSHSQYLVFLSKVELTEVEEQSYETLLLPLQSCSSNLKLVETIYLSLTAKADNTAYKSDIIQTLSEFDYAAFKNRDGLDATMFSQVETFLKSGDVRGAYHRLLLEISDIQTQVNSIKGTLESGGFPTLKVLWDTCQQYGKTLMFGQYVARVFCEINSK